jgi:hypothetical protein
VITEHGERVIARYTSPCRVERRGQRAVAGYCVFEAPTVGGSAISELHRPPLVNLWVLDKKTMRLTNYYGKYDEDVLKKVSSLVAWLNSPRKRIRARSQ